MLHEITVTGPMVGLIQSGAVRQLIMCPAFTGKPSPKVGDVFSFADLEGNVLAESRCVAVQWLKAYSKPDSMEVTQVITGLPVQVLECTTGELLDEFAKGAGEVDWYTMKRNLEHLYGPFPFEGALVKW